MENQTLAFAERTLRDHLALLPEGWGRNFEIVTELSGGGDYSYRVRDGKARFTGSTPGNVLLGVYDYLRAIGFVFLYPGKGGTYVPDLRKPEDLEAEKKPFTASYAHRGICIEGADSLEETLDFIDWLPKNGFNAFFLQFQKPDIFFERWYLHTYNPSLPPEVLTRQQLDGLDRQVEEAMALRGIRCHRVGHGWTAQALGFPGTGWHKTDREPAQKDLVALVNGQRRFWKGIPANTNLCYANPEARKRLVDQVYGPDILTILRMNFAQAEQVAPGVKFDFVLADLGVSSMQIDNPERGFTFKFDGPLDLRLDPSSGVPAAQRLRELDMEDLTALLVENANEPYAEAIAKAVMKVFKSGGTIETTKQLAAVIEGALSFLPQPERKDAIKKSCQRTFQALRIDVNSEFEVLYSFLEKLPDILKSGGRAAVLTFHSGEDRLVKQAFRQYLRQGIFSEAAQEVIRPSAQECFQNPRARSTKLRWAIRA